MPISHNIILDALVNTRSLGGIVNQDGAIIKENKLFRGEELFNATEKDLKTLYTECDIRNIIDFREPEAAQERKDPIYEGFSYYSNPIMPVRANGISRDAKERENYKKHMTTFMAKISMKIMYYIMSTHKLCINSFEKFLRILLNSQQASLWHCAMGKDRAGMGTVLVLRLLDVDEKTILQDYLYTNNCFYGDKKADKTIFGISDYAHKEYYEAFCKGVYKVAGNFDTYFQDYLHITAKEKNTFKELYLK